MIRYTCSTPDCEVSGHFADEPGHCSICLEDLVEFTPDVFAEWLVEEHTSATGIRLAIPKTYVHRRAADVGLDGEEVRAAIAAFRDREAR